MCLFIAAVLISMCSWADGVNLIFKPVLEAELSPACYSGDVVIPAYAEINGETYLVTKIADHCFKCGDEVVSITLPKTIKSIGEYAMANAAISTIFIPNNCSYIGGHAFISESLKVIEVDPDNYFYKSINNDLYDINITTFLQHPFASDEETIVVQEGVTKLNGASLMKFKASVLDLPSTIRLLGSSNFEDCPNLSTLIVRAKDVPYEGNNFDQFRSNCTLFVPAESIEAYKANEWWSGFKEIKSLEEYTPVETVKASAAAVSSVYNVNGTKLAEPTKGLNIIKYASGDTKKVVK